MDSVLVCFGIFVILFGLLSWLVLRNQRIISDNQKVIVKKIDALAKMIIDINQKELILLIGAISPKNLKQN